MIPSSDTNQEVLKSNTNKSWAWTSRKWNDVWTSSAANMWRCDIRWAPPSWVQCFVFFWIWDVFEVGCSKVTKTNLGVFWHAATSKTGRCDLRCFWDLGGLHFSWIWRDLKCCDVWIFSEGAASRCRTLQRAFSGWGVCAATRAFGRSWQRGGLCGEKWGVGCDPFRIEIWYF